MRRVQIVTAVRVGTERWNAYTKRDIEKFTSLYLLFYINKVMCAFTFKLAVNYHKLRTTQSNVCTYCVNYTPMLSTNIPEFIKQGLFCIKITFSILRALTQNKWNVCKSIPDFNAPEVQPLSPSPPHCWFTLARKAIFPALRWKRYWVNVFAVINVASHQLKHFETSVKFRAIFQKTPTLQYFMCR